MVDAAEDFGVSEKTVYDWIKKNKISSPPVVLQGTKEIKVFPPAYIKLARRQLRDGKKPDQRQG